MNKLILLLIVTIACLVYGGCSIKHITAEQIEAGRKRYAMCMPCHGVNGAGSKQMNAPRLAGQYQWYLVRQLQKFQANDRGYTPKDVFGIQMHGIAQALTNKEEIEQVAHYISTLKAPPNKPSFDADIARGKEIYKNCEICHGGSAQGNIASEAPRLNIQFDWYLVRELKNFRDNYRGAKAKYGMEKQMRRLAEQHLTDDADIRDVAAYINTLR